MERKSQPQRWEESNWEGGYRETTHEEDVVNIWILWDFNLNHGQWANHTETRSGAKYLKLPAVTHREMPPKEDPFE